MRTLQQLPIICILLLLQSVSAFSAQFASVDGKVGAGLAEVVKEIERADIIFIGEIHYNPLHHKTQLDIIRSLFAKKKTLAIGVEMFTTDDQQALDDWSTGKLSEESFLPVYERNWSYAWNLYRDLFIFARDNHIRLIALNTPKAVMAKVMAGGPSALKDDEVPPKISWSLNEAQAEYMEIIARQVFGENPPDTMIARFSKAQALRNSGMAWNIVKHRQKHPADTVVVLAGTWHAVRNGVPELLSAHGNLTFKVILPELAELNLENVTVKEADYLIMKQANKSP